MGKKRILGVDRAIMMLCQQARKYWKFYCPAYKQTKIDSHCNLCGHKVDEVEVDHCPPLGPRPRKFEELGDWLNRLFYGPQRGLCHKHHSEVTAEQRKARKCTKLKKNV